MRPLTAPAARRARTAAAALMLIGGAVLPAAAQTSRNSTPTWIWVEGEKPAKSSMHRHPWWYDKVKHDELSGGDLISHFDEKTPGEASYAVTAPKAGAYDFWVRANPVQARLSYKLNDGPWTPIDLGKDQQGSTNIAEDGKPDLRFIAWAHVGSVTLKTGANYVRFRFDSPSSHHGYLDCFVLSVEPFTPSGKARPDQRADVARRAAEANRGWFAFAPPSDEFQPSSGIDLRFLNEAQAGDGGFIGVKDGRFNHSGTGRPERFWAVNGPPGKDRESLRKQARLLAKRGVNLVRIHHGYYDAQGQFDPDAVRVAQEVVEAMKAEGIYSHFSIYFPLWLAPAPGTPWLPGYDGQKHPFAALMFNPEFQEVYRGWWKRLLTTPNPSTGRRLIDEPAVFGAEIQNEDSFFFWTFTPDQIPEDELTLIETRFAAWLAKTYGSPDAALAKWNNLRTDRDRPAEGRIGFRPPWNVFSERTPRDQDQVRFLTDIQSGFYRDMTKFLRDLGFRGVITASNWITASPEVLGPIEKLTYTTTDFLDRHGYFGCNVKGPDDGWAIREGQTYNDRSALRFEPETPGGPKLFAHTAMDPHYAGKPSMCSEMTFNRPNRYRSEAPLYYAAYGALQGSDALVHFAFDGASWTVKPNFFMQPWTLMTPAMMGQFPAAALIFRRGLIAEGDRLVELTLRPDDLLALKGTPLPQDAALDELRLKDVPKGGAAPRPGQVIDPLVHYAGRTSVRFDDRGKTAVKDLRPYVDRAKQTVASTTGQLRLDYGKGLLTLNAPSAQAASGNLAAAGAVALKDITIRSPMDLVHIVAVSLDDRPLASSRKILLQVMTEEKPTDFATEPTPEGPRKITNIGRDPWLIREIEGSIRLKRPDAATLKVTALDANGDPLRTLPPSAEITLAKDVLYYLIEPPAR